MLKILHSFRAHLDMSLVWCASIYTCINVAITHLDFEKSFLSPWCVPWVSTEPVVNTTFISPSEHFHGMTTIITSGCVLVNTWSVVEEVLIDIKSGFHWSVCEDFCLDLIWGCAFNHAVLNTSIFGSWNCFVWRAYTRWYQTLRRCPRLWLIRETAICNSTSVG